MANLKISINFTGIASMTPGIASMTPDQENLGQTKTGQTGPQTQFNDIKQAHTAVS